MSGMFVCVASEPNLEAAVWTDYKRKGGLGHATMSDRGMEGTHLIFISGRRQHL